MLDACPCPICGAQSWEQIGEGTYYANQRNRLGEYLGKIYDVLFDIWAPNEERICLRYKLCGQCGFVLHHPRPTDEDVRRQYALPAWQRGLHGNDPAGREAIRSKRARHLFRTLRRHIKPGARILDFGGGDGRLLAHFVDAGYTCHIVDYVSETSPGTARVAETIDDTPDGEKYDALICNHILEHVTNPLEIMKRLHRHLVRDAVAYIEVPLEIWSRSPNQNAPAVHINFFSEPAVRALLNLSGFKVEQCWTGLYPAPDHWVGDAIRAIGSYSEADIVTSYDANAARRLVCPTQIDRIRKLVQNPGILLNSRRLRRELSLAAENYAGVTAAYKWLKQQRRRIRTDPTS